MSPSKFAMQQGLILALVLTIYTLIVQLTGLYTESWPNYLSFVIYLGFIIYLFGNYKKLNNGYMKLGRAIGIGTLAMTVAGAISAIVTALYIQFVDDSMIKYQMEKQMEEMYNQGMSTEQIEAAEQMAGMFQGPVMIIIAGTIAAALFGVILSLVVGLFMKNNPPEEF